MAQSGVRSRRVPALQIQKGPSKLARAHCWPVLRFYSVCLRKWFLHIVDGVAERKTCIASSFECPIDSSLEDINRLLKLPSLALYPESEAVPSGIKS